MILDKRLNIKWQPLDKALRTLIDVHSHYMDVGLEESMKVDGESKPAMTMYGRAIVLENAIKAIVATFPKEIQGLYELRKFNDGKPNTKKPNAKRYRNYDQL